jgi:sporulation protein YlmC with PRC-barrel domain
MTSNVARIVMISTALAGSAVFAQTNDAGSQGNTSTYQPVHKATAPAADQPADMFVTKQAVTEWRAPKLVGVSVYEVDNKKVGTIKDVLVDHDGSARVIVIGVGGFLGIRARDIGVPFSVIQWQTEGRVVPATNQPPANSLAVTNSGSNQPTSKKTDPAATEASQGHPDKAVLGVTLAQLKMAPDFKYAPDPLAELDSSSGRPQSTNQ